MHQNAPMRAFWCIGDKHSTEIVRNSETSGFKNAGFLRFHCIQIHVSVDRLLNEHPRCIFSSANSAILKRILCQKSFIFAGMGFRGFTFFAIFVIYTLVEAKWTLYDIIHEFIIQYAKTVCLIQYICHADSFLRDICTVFSIPFANFATINVSRKLMISQ